MLDAVRWAPTGDAGLPGKLRLIDQTLLPGELRYIELDDSAEIHDAIKRLVVRGAPAIGCAAALGLAAVCQHSTSGSASQFLEEAVKTADYLDSSRPTAVNLSWALKRCVERLRKEGKTTDDVARLKQILLEEALAILQEDTKLCRSIGENGLDIFESRRNLGVLTHCNAGALATSDYGTALSPIYRAHASGLNPRVFADETRPLLQGARLTAWELKRAGIDVTVICDSAAAQVMREERVSAVIVGADRIAANGDTANKIGTYALAVLAKHHSIPFYVAAPYSTVDRQIETGAGIPIEKRDPDEIRFGFGRRTVPDDCKAYNPAFDVTPHELITGIITERSLCRPPFQESLAAVFTSKNSPHPPKM